MKHYSSLHSERGVNLRDQILHADTGLPIILLLSEESDYVMKMLFNLAEHHLPAHGFQNKTPGKRRFVQLILAKDLMEFEWEKALEDEQWIIIQNCEGLNVEEVDAFNEILRQIYSSELRKANFKLFIVLYPSSEMVSHIFDFRVLGRVENVSV